MEPTNVHSALHTYVIQGFFYFTLGMFSFEINKSDLSDTRCCITTRGNGMERRCTISSLPNYFVMTSCHRNAGQCKQRKQSDYLLFIYSYYVSRMHGYVIISSNIWIFPVIVQFTFLQKKRCIEKLKVIKRYRDIDDWTETNNVTSCTKCVLSQNIVHIC